MALAPHSETQKIRPPAVAGMFYPSNAKELEASVGFYLSEAKAKIPGAGDTVPKAIIAPHAGYVYSGLTAAAAYNTIRPSHATIKRVILLGPCHRVAVRGLALPGTEAFATPLGDVPLDMDAVASIIGLKQVKIFDDTHVQDHSLEVHLPFLQSTLDDFSIVPLIVGQASPQEVAEVLDVLWGGPETLIVISSDLSHYLTYDQARNIDGRTCQAIERLDSEALGDEQACGRHSIRGLMVVAREKGLKVQTAHICNSGDTAGSKDKVVGYGSWLLTEGDGKAASTEVDFGAETREILDQHGETLLRFAAKAIQNHLSKSGPLRVDMKEFAPALKRDGACFVSLDKDGKLRGCIGSIQAWRPLITDVAENACKAAFQDNRFKVLTEQELRDHDITMSISVLSPQVPMTFKNEEDLVGQLRPGIDGVVLQDKKKRGVFLPVVWESLKEPQKFFNQLKRKAGYPEDYWSPTIKAWRYVTESVYSKDLPADDPLWKMD